MRLPEFLTELSPVRETLAALEQGENAMAEAVAEKNGQVCVETATGGLTLWERDYGLPVPGGGLGRGSPCRRPGRHGRGAHPDPRLFEGAVRHAGRRRHGRGGGGLRPLERHGAGGGRGPCSGGCSGPETGGGAAEARPPVGDGAAHGGLDGTPLGGGHRRRDDGGLGVRGNRRSAAGGDLRDGKVGQPLMALPLYGWHIEKPSIAALCCNRRFLAILPIFSE